jgi:hypothetical protein
MKGLEDSVLPIASPMMEGQQKSLDIIQQWTIARWALLKAMVWEHVTREHPIFYNDEERFMLRDGTIPPNTVVWLAGHVGTETFYAAGNRASSPTGAVPQLEAYLTTMAYERLVIQILTVRPYEYVDPYAMLDCDQSVWADAVVRVWPTVNQAFWPPPLILDENTLEAFHKRCDSNVKG